LVLLFVVFNEGLHGKGERKTATQPCGDGETPKTTPQYAEKQRKYRDRKRESDRGKKRLVKLVRKTGSTEERGHN